MDFGLEGRIALVHGAGGGLGGAVALALACEGATVVACDIDASSLEATKAAIAREGGRVVCRTWDLAKVDQFREWHGELVRELGPVDILFNNTGGPPPGTVQGVDRKLWESHFTSMVMSVIGMTDLVLPSMKERGWGRIITSASSGVVAPIPSLGLSNALRSTLAGWSKTLAREVGGDGITSNLIIPGRIATRRIVALDKARAERESRSYESVVQESTSSIPVKRYGEPQEYGAVAAFLASRQASYITGSIVRVDGGLIASV